MVWLGDRQRWSIAPSLVVTQAQRVLKRVFARWGRLIVSVLPFSQEANETDAELKEILLTPPGAAANVLPPGPSLSTAAASPLLINAQSREKRLPISSRGDIDGCHRKHLSPPS